MSDIDLDDANKQADDLWSMAMAGRGDDYDMAVQDAVGTMQALIARVREQEQEIARLRSALEEQQQRAMGQLWAHDQVQHP